MLIEARNLKQYIRVKDPKRMSDRTREATRETEE